MEEVHADEIDNVVPTYGYHRMPIVALGGSAGSLQALKAFFQTVPARSAVAYVVIVHLSPEHESILPTLLQAATAMPVAAARHGELLEKDHVYVIPPGKHLTVINGHLKLTPLEPERGRRVAVDLFFRSLADTHGPHATAVVLSGADGDGAIGIKRIKERGGLTVAQEPDEAEHDGMPRSAIATGMVDWVLRVAEMCGRILQYRASEAQIRLPAEAGPQPGRPAPTSHDEDEQALREVLIFLRSRTAHDFSYYKRATILRRISRRMQINAVPTLPGYLTFLRSQPGEAGGLLQDLLISVTNFFRDREAFAAVEKEIPVLFEDKGPGDVVRVWCAACATGEEVYSFAMLLIEHARTLDNPPTIQVFGCDLDAAAIQTARVGVYPPSIVADVSEERIQRFFTKEVRGYRVRRELREAVLFAEHDLLKDAPFSRMDLIACRNLLIYLDHDAQDRAMDIFHFALRPGGRLFLGNSETVDESKGLFTPLDKKHRIYARRAAPRLGLPVPSGTSAILRSMRAEGKGGPVIPNAAFNRGAGMPFTSSILPAGADERAMLAELHFKLLERLAPPSVVINEQQDIVHLSEHAGRFLRVVGGAPTSNLLRMVNPALRADLRAAIFRATETGEAVDVSGVAVQFEGVTKRVDLRVMPAPELPPGYLVITLGVRPPDTVEADRPVRLEAEGIVHHLELEAEHLRGQLRGTVERYEASTEEYRASNEELQAMNEELRSASEELETSREELQSINEELTTVNIELKSRVEEVGRVNGDLQNFMSATDIATVFLDRDLRVMRYTPASVGFFSLIPGDTGRPLADLKFQVEYPELITDARAVLRHLVPVEREVGRADGGWFLARLLPYRRPHRRRGVDPRGHHRAQAGGRGGPGGLADGRTGARRRRGGQPVQGPVPGRALPRVAHAPDPGRHGGGHARGADRPAAGGPDGPGDDRAQRAPGNPLHRRHPGHDAHQPRQDGNRLPGHGPARGDPARRGGQHAGPDGQGADARRPPRRGGTRLERRLRPAPAGVLEPAQERQQIHARTRPDHPAHAQRARPDRRGGRRHGHRPGGGGHRPHFPPVRAGERRHRGGVRRPRAGPGHRQGDGGGPRRHTERQQPRASAGGHVHREPAPGHSQVAGFVSKEAMDDQPERQRVKPARGKTFYFPAPLYLSARISLLL